MWDLYYAVNQSLLNWLLSRGIVAVGMHFTGHCCCGKVAIEERLKQLQIYGEKSMAMVETWPLVEVQLC